MSPSAGWQKDRGLGPDGGTDVEVDLAGGKPRTGAHG
jgi:hypothetical protein